MIKSLIAIFLIFSENLVAQGTENFSNIPTNNSTNYQARTWTGTDGVTWTALGARTDQTLNGKAICFGGSNTRRVLSPTYTGGMGTLSFNYVRAFTNSDARSIEVYVNNTLIGASINVSSSSNTVVAYSQAINVSGNVILEIRSTGTGQVKIDDISWTPYTAVPTSLNSAVLTSYLNTIYGIPSASTSFIASGTSLTNNITVTAQSGYQVSTNNSVFSSSVSVSNNSTIYIRFAANMPVGSYNSSVAAILSSTGASNVNITTSSSGNIILPATVNVTAGDQSVTSGTAVSTVLSSGTYSLSGFVNGESSAVVSGTVTYNTNYTSSSSVGASGLTITPVVSGLLATNYQFIAVDGIVSVIAASMPTIVIDDSNVSDFGTICVSNSSSEMSFTVSGNNLSNPISISAPIGFEISTFSALNFIATSPIVLNPTGGSVNPTPIYIRFVPGAEQAFSSQIDITSTGALSESVLVSGIGTNGVLSVTTIPATSVSYLSAFSGGESLFSSCGTIVSKGIVYGLNPSPILTSNSTTDGSGSADYNSSIDLSTFTAGQVIYYRSYITSSFGITHYGSELNLIVPQIPCTDLFISEYVEGSSNNKFLELFNPTNTQVNLSNYALRVYYNGSSTYSEYQLLGTISAFSTLVLKNASANTYNGIAVTSSIINFNGDDAIALVKNGTNIDVFGQIGFDPGNGWVLNGVSTLDKTLRRKFTVSGGDINGTDSFDPSLEWDVFPIDNVNELGMFNAPVSEDQTFCIYTNPIVGQLQVTGQIGLPINWFDQLTSTTPLLNSSLLSNSTYFVSQSSSGCSSSRKAVQITLSNLNTSAVLNSGDFIWSGAVSADYNNASNWYLYNGTSFFQASTVPNSATNMIVPENQTCVLEQPAVLSGGNVNANDVLIEAGATLSLGTGTLNIFGNYTNNGTLNGGSGVVAFKGTSGNQTISKAGGEIFPFMIVDKTSGNVVLENNVTVSGGLTLTNGLVEVGTNNMFMGAATLTGGSATSYVKTASIGVMSRNVGASATTFPVGNSSYNPAMVTNAGTADVFTLRVIDNVTADGTGVGAPTTEAAVNRTWMVNEATTGGSNVTLRLYWNGAGEQINGFSPASAFIAHYIASSGLWDNIGFSGQGAGYFETNNITSFSPFTISSSTTFAPLPTELVSFQANCAGDKVNVTWTTASEHNTSHYIVEHSRNGNDWYALTMLAAAGNATSLLDYTYVHENPNTGTNYYRLTQYDNDGVFEQFNAVAVDCDNINKTATLSTYPNPSEGSFYISLFTEDMKGAGVITITDTKGTVVYTQDVNIQNGNTIFHMDNLNVAPGMYYIQVANGNTSTDIVKHSLR